MRLRMRSDRHLEAVPTPPSNTVPEIAPDPALEPPPGLPSRTLRAQLTGSDARTERLVRQVRAEIDDLRALLDTSVEARDGLYHLDYEAIVGDPAAVAALSHETLTRNLLTAARRVVDLELALEARQSDFEAQRTILEEMRRDESWMRGRYESLTEVIAALHGNLEDLRRSRDAMLGIAPPAERPGIAQPRPWGEG
ncbi:MAG TPA: hypothetical protein VFK32_07105 [Tepidiformaceae bacterium]|nr:hypothetical protein [Tepidiformaceae bacterium]